MKRVLASVIVAGLATVAFATSSHAGANANAKIQLHVLGTTAKAQCTRTAATPACQSVITNAPVGGNYYTYLLVTDGNQAAGIAGVQFGIVYPAGWFVEWHICATLEFAMAGFPQSGTGDLVTWDSTTRCQRSEPGGAGTGVVAPAGYFYMTPYTPGVMQVVPRQADNVAKVADCTAAEDVVEGGGVVRTPSHLGAAGFPSGGFNPCGLVTPVQSTTWGAVKSIYSR